MSYYYECFNKKICLKIKNNNVNMLNFWLKRFCPNIEKTDNCIRKIDLYIEIKLSKNYDYVIDEKKNIITIYGGKVENFSFIAKFITQCFQKLLVEDGILIIPAACISSGRNCLLIVGDFWQGKTSVAMSLATAQKNILISDNYVAIKNNHVIGATKYISVRKEDIKNNLNSIYNVNDRFFYENEFKIDEELKIIGFLLPYINNGDNNIHIISKEESKWYLYQKFIRLLCGEAVLFDGKLPSPIFLDKPSSLKILNIVDKLLFNNEIKYVSSSIDIIKSEGKKILFNGENNE